MKKIGIIGGLAWPSTIDYYRLLCSKTNKYFQAKGATLPYPTPHIIIESLNINDMRKLRGKDGDEASWENFDNIFRATFLRLETAGAELGMIASNTPHTRLKSITNGLTLPIVSILDTTATTVRALGGKRALILGTSVTMKSSAYPETLKNSGVEALPQLKDKEVEELERIIDVDLSQDKITEAREGILMLCEMYVSNPASDIVCLACTELPLAFPEHQNSAHFTVNGISFVNTTVAHIEAVLQEALQ